MTGQIGYREHISIGETAGNVLYEHVLVSMTDVSACQCIERSVSTYPAQEHISACSQYGRAKGNYPIRRGHVDLNR